MVAQGRGGVHSAFEDGGDVKLQAKKGQPSKTCLTAVSYMRRGEPVPLITPYWYGPFWSEPPWNDWLC